MGRSSIQMELPSRPISTGNLVTPTKTNMPTTISEKNGEIVVSFTATEIMKLFGVYRTQPKNPSHTLDSDSQLIEVAKSLGATHLRFPLYDDGWIVKEEKGGFLPLARYGNYDDGRFWVTRTSGSYFPRDMRDKLMELPNE